MEIACRTHHGQGSRLTLGSRDPDADIRDEELVCKVFALVLSENRAEAVNAFERLHNLVGKNASSGGALKNKLTTMLAAGNASAAQHLAQLRHRIKHLEDECRILRDKASAVRDRPGADAQIRQLEQEAARLRLQVSGFERTQADKDNEIFRHTCTIKELRARNEDSWNQAKGLGAKAFLGGVLLGGAVIAFSLQGPARRVAPMPAGTAAPVPTVLAPTQGGSVAVPPRAPMLRPPTAAPQARERPSAANAAPQPGNVAWSHWTPNGTGWKLQRSARPNRYELMVAVGLQDKITLLVEPSFLDLPHSEMESRVEWLRLQLLDPAQWGHVFEYTREGYLARVF